MKEMQRRRKGRPTGRSARYLVIAEHLRKSISSGEWKIDKPIPSCRALAQLYDVSPRTAWMAVKVLEHDGHIRMRPRYSSVASRPVPIASVMKGVIAVVTKMDFDEFFISARDEGELFGVGAGILKELSKTRTSLLALQNIRWWRRECPQGLRDVSIRGVIITALLAPPLLKEYASMGVPVVVVDQPARIPGVHSVTMANREAAAEATRQLLSEGRRKLAFVRAIVGSLRDVDPDAKERQDGFVAACREARLPDKDFAIFSAPYEQVSTLSQLIRIKPPYTGILTSSELHAAQLVDLANKARVNVPKDISLVTFHNRKHPTRNWSGPALDFEEMGRIAVRLLVNGPTSLQHVRVNPIWNIGATLSSRQRQFDLLQT